MPRVLRLNLHDDETSFVLINVDSSKARSHRPLDLLLVGTENEAVYVLSLKHDKVSSLKAKKSSCSKNEWETILQSILLGTVLEDSQTGLLDGVEAVASIEPQKSIDVTIRKRTEGITQRLGALQLLQQEEEVDLFEWCGLAVRSHTDAVNEASSLKLKYKVQQETIEKLNNQLEELIAAKAQHEAELLEKFRDLLNEKKSKIRDQQRLLATAKVDPKKLANVQTSRASGSSRSGKRKAETEDDQIDEDEDFGFEKMDIDTDQLPNDSGQETAQTPDLEGEETASEDDPNDVPAAHSPARSTRQVDANRRKPSTKSDKKGSARESSSRETGTEKLLKTPPKRELPFPRKEAPKGASASKRLPGAADDKTAAEDDEL